jgi:hypothetical protein
VSLLPDYSTFDKCLPPLLANWPLGYLRSVLILIAIVCLHLDLHYHGRAGRQQSDCREF